MRSTTGITTFGSWLKRRRKQLDLTQDELGRLSGCSGAAIRKFEAEERKPSRELAELLARTLKIPEHEREAFIKLARGGDIDMLPSDLPLDSTLRFAILPTENLPAPLTSLVDRVHEAEAVSALLIDPAIRWVSLIGPPGIGKTRLSIQVGRSVLAHFADGVWFVDLAPLEQASHILPTICRSLSPLGLLPNITLEQLTTMLKSRSMLLVLDNFEHVTEAAIEIADLLKRCAGLKVLATSRIPLHIYGEHEYRVPPLAIPPADAVKRPDTLLEYESVQLFVTRARQHQPDFRITPENAPVIINVCTTLEGMPLALELAAASLQRMTLIEMDAVFHHIEGVSWIRLFGTPARDLPARQRTLENVVAWSYTLLTDLQQELFCKLGLFSGWFELSAVIATCFDKPQRTRAEVRGLLDVLTDHSLLERDNIDGIPCWRMLEIIHEYAVLQLDPTLRANLESRIAHYFLENLHAIKNDSQQQNIFFKIYTASLHASLKWFIAGQQTETGFQMAGYLDELWSNQGFFREGLDLLKQLFALPDQSAPETRAYRLQQASDLAWQVHDFDTAIDFALQAAELGRVHNLHGEYPLYLNRLGRIYIEQGKYTEAIQVISECLALANQEPAILNPGIPLAQLGEIAFFENRLGEAREILERALSQLPVDEDIFIAIALTDLAEIALAENDCKQAYRRLIQVSNIPSLLMRRSLVFLCALAGYLVLSCDEKTAKIKAAQLYGAIELWSERSGVILSRFYINLNQSRIHMIREQLSPEEWQAEYNFGRQWSWEKVMAEAKAQLVERA